MSQTAFLISLFTRTHEMRIVCVIFRPFKDFFHNISFIGMASDRDAQGQRSAADFKI